ncbi:MAG: hypothetical protein O0V67_09775 [Methanocorpusculum sp.]|nr:hypothetical protein [Methanocorpusculum sp.]
MPVTCISAASSFLVAFGCVECLEKEKQFFPEDQREDAVLNRTLFLSAGVVADISVVGKRVNDVLPFQPLKLIT